MAKRERMTEEEIRSKVARAVEAAYAYDNDEVASDNVSAIEYFNGEMRDVPAPRGESQAVSRDVSDTISWLMPQVMRTFTSSDKLVQFEPRRPNDVATAQQATDYINFLAIEECDFYNVLYAAVHDGFQLRNGYIKHWWDASPEEDVATYSGISQDMVTQIVSGDDTEVLEASEAEPEVVTSQGPDGQPVQYEEPRYDLKVKTVVSKGRLCVEAVPPEEFLIERGALSLRDARVVGHRRRRMRSDLIEEGYDEAKVNQIPGYDGLWDRNEELARNERLTSDIDRGEALDKASEWIEVVEAYCRLDTNGDGVTEWVRCILGGVGGGSVLLDWEEWDAELPFTEIRPDPIPHRFLGRSIYDLVKDVQQQKTVVLRQMLQNTYLHNHPTPVVNRRAVKDQASIDALMTPGTGYVEVDDVPSNAITWLQVPFVGQECLGLLEYLDQVREMRTGMSRVAMGLSQDVLQNQTATAISESSSAQHAKLELYCRNIAESLKRVFRAIYRIVVENQDRPRIIRLRDTFVEVDPRPWGAEMDVTVNVGLGTGSRDKDAAAIAELGMWGQNVISLFGPDNPVFGITQAREIGVMMAETRGLKAYERIVGGGDGAIEQWQQQQAEAAQQPDPKVEAEMQKAQAQMQIEQQKAQMDAQSKQQELQQRGQIETAKMQQDAQVQREKMQSEIALQREKMVGEMQLRERQMGMELALKERTTMEELRMKRELGMMYPAGGPNGIRVGGEPG